MQMSSDPAFCSFEAPSCPGTCMGCPNGRVLNASLIPNGSGQFDPMQLMVGDLVGVDRKVSASQDQCAPGNPCAKLHAMLNMPCRGLCKVVASLNPNSTGHFDAMKPTVGDLVGIETVDVAASAPPVVRRIDGRFDPMQPTVGDLSVRGHTSMRTVNIEPGDITVHPRRVRMCSR